MSDSSSRGSSTAADSPADTLEVGYIGKPHGLRGEVRLVLHNPQSEALDSAERVILLRDGAYSEREIVGVRGNNKAYVVRLLGIDSREDAEALRGCAVLVARQDLPDLEPGEYYLSDLMGARVEGPDGWTGEVVDLAIHPTVDCVIIRDATGRRFEQPLLEPWLEEVDIQARVVRLRNLDGLIE